MYIKIENFEGVFNELKYWNACFAALSICLDTLFFRLINIDITRELIIYHVFTIGNRREHEKFVFW